MAGPVYNPFGVSTPGPAPGSAGAVNIPFSQGSQRAAPGPAETPEEVQDQSGFVQSVEQQFGTLGGQTIEAMFVASGVDMDEPFVQDALEQAKADMRGAETETARQNTIAMVQSYLPFMADKFPAVPATQWSEALASSNLEDAILPSGAQQAAMRGRYEQVAGHPPPAGTMSTKFVRDPDTGWVRYVGDVLVDPTVPLGSAGAVVFGPSSTAPGSPLWLSGVQTTWSDEKVAEWRKRLFEYGYLTKDQSKIKGAPDLVMLNALTMYHEIRYQNGGTPLKADAAGVAGAGSEYNLTAKDFQVVIRNDVREQFRNAFGNDPSDAELEQWTRFVTQTSLKAQRSLTKKGASPSAAGSAAANIASERLIERFENQPQVQLVQDAAEENSSLRDALSSAVVATRSLSG